VDHAQTAQLLTVIATYDRRQLGDADVLSWHEAVGDLDYDACREAVARHYKSATDWLMPAHVRRLATAASNDRASRAVIGAVCTPDGCGPKPEWFDAAAAAFKRGDGAEGERIVRQRSV